VQEKALLEAENAAENKFDIIVLKDYIYQISKELHWKFFSEAVPE